MKKRNEDEIRNQAGVTLGFTDSKGSNVENDKVISGVGQITTFNELGKKLNITKFEGLSDKPDGWCLPKSANEVALILETKAEKMDIYTKKFEDELLKNIKIVSKQYNKTVGILYNGEDVRVYIDGIESKDETISKKLHNYAYYAKLVTEFKIDKEHIFDVTKNINDNLHSKFGMNSLNHRMIFTACALVAQRFNPKDGLQNLKNMGYDTFKNWVINALKVAIDDDKRKNMKLDILIEEYSKVDMSIKEDQSAINDFIDDVCDIAELVNSDYWNGEDVMAIFFNEFNRYSKKTDAGQVFTPDHITSLMYRLIDIDKDDRVLDATCGSGAFLVKAMCNMIKESGGVNSKKAAEIKSAQLFGIEMYKHIFALACANMLIHKDGKTNLEQMDARSDEASKWIKDKDITKVLMNPPFEQIYGCMDIVNNVLDSVPKGTKCAFILPDKKLEKEGKDSKHGNKVLKNHTLKTVIKLPENLFFGKGVTTSIFIFESGKPQDNKDIIGYYIEDDGLETVKNKGRQDIKGKWQSIEDYWVTAIMNGEDKEFGTKQIINPKEHLSYQMSETPFEVFEDDFLKTMMDYKMYQDRIDVNEFKTDLIEKIFYASNISAKNDKAIITLEGDKENE